MRSFAASNSEEFLCLLRLPLNPRFYTTLDILPIWESYIEQAKSGEIERKDEFVSQVFHLSRKVTENKIPQACFDCIEVYKSAGRIEEVGKTISLLIERLPEANQAKTWKSVIEFGLEQKASFVPWYEPTKLAKYVEKIMPNHLWLQTMQ